MKHTYQLTGMTCSSCESKVKTALLALKDVEAVEVSREKEAAFITMRKHIPIADIQIALGRLDEKYKIADVNENEIVSQTRTWFDTYKPILLIFSFITFISVVSSFHEGSIDSMDFMRVFMAGFFLTFSFFKLLNLKGFAESYMMYDVLARKIPAWAYIYAFVELALGIAYTINFNPFITNLTTVLVMSVSIVGVLQSVLNKKKIQCACLGAIFNLPMSTVTIIEDGLMIVMSIAMIIQLY
ncbi:MAG: cation transporter [Bacteroidia bacterium]|nr:cation transporter [Bacteroidia bacterium]